MRTLKTRRALAFLSTTSASLIAVSAMACAAPAVASATPTAAAPAATSADTTSQGATSNAYIVKYKATSASGGAIASAQSTGEEVSDTLPSITTNAINQAASAADASVQAVTAHSGSLVSVRLSASLDESSAEAFISSLAAQPDVEYVEPDLIMTTMSTPNDEYFSRQWDLGSASYGMNAVDAWSASTGRDVAVAVIDTGIVNHADLNNQVLPGYDFITDSTVSRDGDGADDDPSDAGDWVVSDNECYPGSKASSSSWHGTHVAGTVAAQTNNGIGTAGVAPDAKIVPVRVLGKCGGSSSDIVDGITWSSGGHVNGVPDNQHPAKVINMSLGGGNAVCPAYYQEAIDAATARGSVVVVAAGNGNRDASMDSPANCRNVITVGATGDAGARAYYSNYGNAVEVSAPGGDMMTGKGIYSTVDRGATTPNSATYGYMQGTSQAAPHVAGTVALMAAIKPSLTLSEATTILQNTSNPLTRCDKSYCGTGIIDAAKAVAVLSGNAATEPDTDDTDDQPAAAATGLNPRSGIASDTSSATLS